MLARLKYSILIVLIAGCARHYHVTESKALHYDVKEAKADSLTMVHIAPYKNKLAAEMDKIVAVSDTVLTKDGFETTLGNFVLLSLDHFVRENYPQLKENFIPIINRGGLRNNLPSGKISIGNIFELMPFDNEIVIITINGDKMKQCADAVASNGKILPLNIELTKTKDKLERILVLEKELSPNENYTVVTTDYLAGGGDNCSFFLNPVSYKATRIKLRDAIISYCNYLTANQKTIKPYLHGKFRISK